MDNLLPVLKYIVSYAIPIITCVTVVIGGVWTLYKYFKEKSSDFYAEILTRVYEPLFSELVKMEYSRKLLNESIRIKENKRKKFNIVAFFQNIFDNAFSINKTPFIKWSGTKTNTKMEIEKTTVSKEEYDILDFENILKEIHDTPDKLKYAPRDLVALIKSYFFLEQVRGVPAYEKEKLKIQKHIRRNVIIGYKKYRKKLGLKDVLCTKFCRSFMGLMFFN